MKMKCFLVAVFSIFLIFGCDADRRTAQREGYDEEKSDYLEKDGNALELEKETVEFMKMAASSSLMEIELGKVAQEKSQVQKIKDYAATIVNDHQNANDQLMEVAKQLNVTLPNQMMEEHQEKVKELREAKKQEFDKMFTEIMVETHQNTIEKFEDMRDDVIHKDVTDWMQKTLPVLKKHHDKAKTLKETAGKGV